jgi:hypothetical protein
MSHSILDPATRRRQASPLGGRLAAPVLAAALGAFAMNITHADSDAERRVVDHLQATFGLPRDAVQIVSLAPRDLPGGSAEFFAETKGSSGHDNYNYVVIGTQVYCSRVPGEFARLLREQSLLQRNDVTAAQYTRLYALFELPRELKYIDANVLGRNAASYRDFPQVRPPALTRAADGSILLTFFATPALLVQPLKVIVAVSPAYDMKVSTEELTRR